MCLIAADWKGTIESEIIPGTKSPDGEAGFLPLEVVTALGTLLSCYKWN